MLYCKTALVFFLLLSLLASLANAETNLTGPPVDDYDCTPRDAIAYRGFTIRIENDSFAKTDRNYTNGLAITSESHDIANYSKTECLPIILRAHTKIFDLIIPNFFNISEEMTPADSIVVKIGQSIYTPKDSINKEIVLDDRPYAGLLYVGLSHHQRRSILKSNIEMFEAREISLGVIGPLSFAKEFQDAVHDLLGDNRFKGWSHQLSNEPAIQIAWDRKFKEYRGNSPVLSGFSTDLISSAGLRLGNIESSANLGIEARIGWDIPNDFGSITIRPGTDSRPPDIEPSHDPNNTDTTISDAPRFGFHFFTILELKFIGYNFSTDGNLYNSSHSVTRESLNAFGALGFGFPTIIKKRGYNLSIMQVYQSSDFKEQGAHHAYRAIAVSVEF